MKEETKELLRNSLVSCIQMDLGRIVDDLCEETRYMTKPPKYQAVGIRVINKRFQLMTDMDADAPDKNPWENDESVTYLGTICMEGLRASDYRCEFDAFQDQLEAYINKFLDE